MGDEDLINEIVSIARRYADSRLGEVDADTPLLNRFEDPEDFGELAEFLEQRYGLAKPHIDDIKEYHSKLRRMRKWSLLDLLLPRSPEPVVYLPDLTCRELATIVQSGAWPNEFAYPSVPSDPFSKS